MTVLHFAGAMVILIGLTLVGIYSGRKVKTGSDFTTSGRAAGTGIITGVLIGTLVGGASTIGTAQLAYSYGFSACWFTLGGGIGLIIMYLFYAKPLYQRGFATMPHLFAAEYGKGIAAVATVLMSAGTFLSIVSQLLSGLALVSSVCGLVPWAETAIVVGLMLVYVIFGGMWGAGMAGIFKTILLYVTTLLCGCATLQMTGGIAELRDMLPAQQYFNPFARGFVVDGGAGLSLVFGILTTQAYMQAVVSAKSLAAAKKALFIAGVLTPVVGAAGILVGMTMRILEPGISPAAALPAFALYYLPPFWGGVVLATLLVALVGTGAGLTLGLSAMFCSDIYSVYIDKKASGRRLLLVSRVTIAVILAAAAMVTLLNGDSLILDWSFMSMGLRGAVAFAPLSFALFAPGRVKPVYALAAIMAGPCCVLVGKLVLPQGVDSLTVGITVSLIIMGFGLLSKAQLAEPEKSKKFFQKNRGK